MGAVSMGLAVAAADDLPLRPLTAEQLSVDRIRMAAAQATGDRVWQVYGRTGPASSITVRPVTVETPLLPEPGMTEGTNLSRLAVRITADWMPGEMELRLPEVVQSSMGTHFIDHKVSHAPQLNPLPDWPHWRRDGRTGAWSYTCRTIEGLVFSGRVQAHRDSLILALTIENRTGEDLAWVTANPCFTLEDNGVFGTRGSLEGLHVIRDGAWYELTGATPTPAQKGRGPWVIMRMKENGDAWQGPDDSPTWWLLDQWADTNVMGASGRNGTHWLGYVWSVAPAVLMCNAGNPCFHTGPGPTIPLADGESVVHRGRIYMTAEDPDALLERIRADRDTWQRRPVRSGQPDGAAAGGEAGRLHAARRVPGGVDETFPGGRVLVLGPLEPEAAPPDRCEQVALAARLPQGWRRDDGSIARWNSAEANPPVPEDHLSPEVIRTQGDWFKASSGVYLLWTEVVAERQQAVRLHCVEDDLIAASLNGVEVGEVRAALRPGVNRLVLAVHCRAGGTARQTAFFLRLTDPLSGERLTQIRYRRPSVTTATGPLVSAQPLPQQPQTIREGGHPAMLAEPNDALPPALRLPQIGGGVSPGPRAPDRVRVAVVQTQVNKDDLADGCTEADALAPHIARAAAEGADLVVLPEYVFGSFKQGDAKCEALRGLARKHELNVMVGGWEYLEDTPIHHPPRRDSFANSILVIDRRGTIVGTHRKMHAAVAPTSPHFWPEEDGETGEGLMRAGNRPTVLDLDIGRIGVLTCYDGYFFSSFEAPSLRGAEILVWPNGRGGALEDWIIKTASFLTATHVVASNMAVGAGSTICQHPAQILARAEQPGEQFIIADLDMAALRRARRSHRMLHQRRPGVYADLVQDWRPWEAYPETDPFRYEGEAPGASVAEKEETMLRGGADPVTSPLPVPAADAPRRDDGILRVALLQLEAAGNDQAANLALAVDACRKAAARGADIALLPEMFQIGYRGFDGAGEEGRPAWQAQAIGPDSEYMTTLRALAAELRMAVGATYLQAWHGADPRNAITLIDRHGRDLYTYGKMHTCDFANFEAACTPGTTFHVAALDTAIGPVRVGAMICYDREFPESARILMVKGAELVLTPNACRLDDLRLHQFQARAFENAMVMLMTNHAGEAFRGRSVAYGADGGLLAEAGESPEILMVEVDMAAVRDYRSKTLWGNAYRRPRRYGPLLDTTVTPEFQRTNASGTPFRRDQR